MFSRQLLHIASHIEYYEQNKRPTTKTILNDRSFLSTIAYYMAFSGESGLLSKRIDLILDLEMHFLPRALQPNHIIFLLNEPFEESKEELENYSKLSKAYAEVIQYSKELFPNAKKFGHKIAKNGAKESAKELFELLK